MNVNSVTNAYSRPEQRRRRDILDGDGDLRNFLKLLMAQMKNQDPTEPMKSTEYMAQLATFSQVEQTMKTNTKLDALLTSSALAQADSVIGRTVTTADGKITGEVTSVMITNEGAVAKLKDGEAASPRPRRRRELTMNEVDALELVRAAIWTVIIAAGPAVAAAMVIGIVIALIQALTQIQEVTLTFIPKIVAILVVALVTGSFVGSQIFAFTELVYGRIVTRVLRGRESARGAKPACDPRASFMVHAVGLTVHSLS